MWCTVHTVSWYDSFELKNFCKKFLTFDNVVMEVEGDIIEEPTTKDYEFDIYETYMNPWKSWVPQLFSVLTLIIGSVLIFVYSSKTWYVAITFLLFASVILLRTKREKYRFEMLSKKFIMSTWTITGKKSTLIRFREIKEVVLEESLDAQGKSFRHLRNVYESIHQGLLTCHCRR